MVSRHWHDEALQRMQQRATPEATLRLRRSTVEHRGSQLESPHLRPPPFLLRGRQGAQAEMSLAVIVFNLKSYDEHSGRPQLTAALALA